MAFPRSQGTLHNAILNGSVSLFSKGEGVRAQNEHLVGLEPGDPSIVTVLRHGGVNKAKEKKSHKPGQVVHG